MCIEIHQNLKRLMRQIAKLAQFYPGCHSMVIQLYLSQFKFKTFNF